MAQAEVNREYVTFVRGLITEASALSFPENASIDEDNFVLNRDGSRQRRLGFDYETGAVHVDTGIAYSSTENKAITTHIWDNVDKNAELVFFVVQFGDELFFFDTNETPISAQYKNSVTLTKRSGGTLGTFPIETSAGSGVLVVVGHDFEPQYITYDGVSGTFTSNPITIEIRDFLGIKDLDTDGTTLDIDENPVGLSNEHKYNLYNQGWRDGTIVLYFASAANYPSSTQIDYFGNYIEPTGGIKSWSIGPISSTIFGTTPAPKGKYVISAFTRSASRIDKSGVTVPSDTENNRPTATAYFYGRIFYGGIESDREGTETIFPNYNGYIFFSSILTTIDKIGFCYQEADPTAEAISDLVATDGGTLQISDINILLRFEVIGDSLLCVCDNGVWEITATDSSGFSADNFHIRKITSVGALNKRSIVKAENSLAYWSSSGIYLISPDETSGKLQSQNMTQDTIQTYYLGIDSIGKSRATGLYDIEERKVKWLYNDGTSYDGISYKNKYNRELVFDVVLKAFYPYSISELGTTVDPFIAGFFRIPQYSISEQSDNVVDAGVQVVDGANGNVTNSSSVQVGTESGVRYVVLSTASNDASGNWRITFGNYNSLTFRDWYTNDSTGVDYTSFLHTGYETLGDSARKKRATYIATLFERTETGFTDDGTGQLSPILPSGCLIQGRWDFANSSNSGKYTTQFQAYRLIRRYLPTSASDTFDYGQSVVATKNKIRGSGKALTLYMTSETGKDMNILGWNIAFTGGTRL